MSQPMAIQATFSDFKLIRGRKCCQLVFEIPLEGADAALVSLGGLPQPSQEAWFGIARLDTTQPKPKALGAPAQRDSDPSKERRPFDSLRYSTQAGIRCEDPVFKKFIEERYHTLDIVGQVRNICDVQSRSTIAKGTPSGTRWELLESSFRAWKDAG